MWALFFFLFLLCFILFISWWIFSPLKTISELDGLKIEDIKKGQEELAQHKVVIVGIIRDNSAELPSVMKYIEHTGGYFKDYKVIIFENDSVDGTKEILTNWHQLNPRVNVISATFNNEKRPEIGFLATSRNYYLKKLQNDPQYSDFDMMMVVDMDMDRGWDIRGIFSSFSKIDNWDVVCSNGTLPSGKMWDAFAFRIKEFPQTVANTANYWTKIIPQIQKKYPISLRLLPVESCFGGMALYKRSVISNCKYSSPEGDCEHVAFHECMKKQQNAKIFMNLAQVMHYPAIEDAILWESFSDKLHYKLLYNIKKWLNLASWRMNGKY